MTPNGGCIEDTGSPLGEELQPLVGSLIEGPRSTLSSMRNPVFAREPILVKKRNDRAAHAEVPGGTMSSPDTRGGR